MLQSMEKIPAFRTPVDMKPVGTFAEQPFQIERHACIRAFTHADSFLRSVLRGFMAIRKVNVSLIRRWVEQKLEAILGFDDDVLSGMVMELLAEKPLDPRKVQLNVTAFLAEKAAPFCAELWGLLVSANQSPLGIPAALLEAKKAELRARRGQEEERLAALKSTWASAENRAPGAPEPSADAATCAQVRSRGRRAEPVAPVVAPAEVSPADAVAELARREAAAAVVASTAAATAAAPHGGAGASNKRRRSQTREERDRGRRRRRSRSRERGGDRRRDSRGRRGRRRRSRSRSRSRGRRDWEDRARGRRRPSRDSRDRRSRSRSSGRRDRRNHGRRSRSRSRSRGHGRRHDRSRS